MEVLQPLWEQGFFPLFRFNFSPNAVIKPGFELLIIEIPMYVRQDLRDFVEQVDHFVLGSLDNFLKQVLVDDPIGKLEVFCDDSDNLSVIFEVEQHIADLVNEEGLHVSILEEVIVLDVYLQRFSLISRFFRVED